VSSKRNTTTVNSSRVDDDTLLDAARACVLSVGVRRTTLTDIARRAGASRMTLYRRFPGVSSVLAALMTREFGGLLGQVFAEHVDGPHTRARLVAASTDAVRRMVADPLLASVLDRDPELLLPYLVERVGATQRLAERFLADALAAGHADGSIRVGRLDVQARAYFITVQAFAISHRPACSDLPWDDLLTELAIALDHALRPFDGEGT
jgi:AcrR family transcriptional regulator